MMDLPEILKYNYSGSIDSVCTLSHLRSDCESKGRRGHYSCGLFFINSKVIA